MSVVFRLGAEQNEFIEADTATELDPRVDADVTDHPLEDGSLVADGITPKPRRIALELLFTPDPDGRPEALPGGPTRPEMARRRLLRAAERGEVFQLEVDGDVYYPAVFGTVSAPRTAADGSSRRLRVEVRELLIAESLASRVSVRRKKRAAKGVRHKLAKFNRGDIPPDGTMPPLDLSRMPVAADGTEPPLDPQSWDIKAGVPGLVVDLPEAF